MSLLLWSLHHLAAELDRDPSKLTASAWLHALVAPHQLDYVYCGLPWKLHDLPHYWAELPDFEQCLPGILNRLPKSAETLPLVIQLLLLWLVHILPTSLWQLPLVAQELAQVSS